MQHYYSDEKAAQVVAALLKAHGIRRVIASSGTANMALVGSLQYDPYFEVYSSVDERSSAYMACGLAAETGEPVVISCTGATASRNYLPGLTEAFYRKLPVLAITSMQASAKVGHLVAQVIDRTSKPEDTVRLSVRLPFIKDEDDLWECEIKVNRAILELFRHGGGPAHIDLQTSYLGTFNTRELPECRVVKRVSAGDSFPDLPTGKIVVFIGAHRTWTQAESEALDKFCESNDAFVVCDHTSSYNGRFRVPYALIGAQKHSRRSKFTPDLLIHIGEVSGDYYSFSMSGKQVWRVSEDGEIRDTFRKLRYIFEIPESRFFSHYTKPVAPIADSALQLCKNQLAEIQAKIPEIPFSNIWIASKIAHRIPSGSEVHFGILNSLRSWNFFELPHSVSSSCNVGGFGIDGGLSTLVGASLANQNKLYYCIIGDLAFFYDMNVMGNRHTGKNLRILLVNNGKGTEFRQYAHPAAHLGDAADQFISGAGHFGNQSRTLVKHYAEDLGFDYFAASDKQEFEATCEPFLAPEVGGRSLLFEVFTDSQEESKALELMMNIEVENADRAKILAKKFLGKKTRTFLKNLVK